MIALFAEKPLHGAVDGKPNDIDSEDLAVLATFKSNPALWAQLTRLARLCRDEDPSCLLADQAEDAIDQAGQAMKLETLRGWARSCAGHAELARAASGSGKRSKKNS